MPLRAVGAAARALDLEGRSILLAVSGGVDSTALVYIFRDLAEDLHINLSIGHVNHGLRGAQSEADAAFVVGLGEALGLPVRTARIDPEAARAGRPSRTRPTLEEAARRCRYEALRRLASEAGAERIATAHTADDQAETVLLRLLRGTGPTGLGGIPRRSSDGTVVRPLLRVSRGEILEFARARGFAWREDPSNADPRFSRNRLRHHWLPGLREAFNPRLLRALGDLAEAQQEEAEWIESLVACEADQRFTREASGALRIAPEAWDAVPDALARRLAREALRRCGAEREVSRVHLDRVVRFLRTGRRGTRIELPPGLELAREREAFRLGQRRGSPRGSVLSCNQRKGNSPRVVPVRESRRSFRDPAVL